jgi:hypothetical protein
MLDPPYWGTRPRMSHTTSRRPAHPAAVAGRGAPRYELREPGAVVIDIPGVLDTEDRDPALDALRAALDQCQEPLLVVRLTGSIVTSTALHVLSDAHGHAAALGIALRVEAKPSSVHVFRIVGLTHLLKSA